MSEPGVEPRGFTLIELIIALVLSTFVITALVGVISQMMRGQMEGSAKAVASGWTHMSIDAMQKDISNSSVLYCPFVDASHPGCTGPATSVLSACSNYTLNPGTGMGAAGGPLDGVAANVRSSYYCVWSAGTPSGTPWLLRYTGTTCPIAPTPVCGTGSFQVVAQDIHPFDPAQDFLFQRADDAAGVQISFTIGRSTATANNPNPSYSKVRTRITMQKSFANSYD
jgi:prepilin-type N-terminal cleavage/methylation domain-containing protein